MAKLNEEILLVSKLESKTSKQQKEKQEHK